ncbi:Protein of unknown function (DUF1676) [Popillia japonica]|uniref:Uncharacterized protein n=1 Tax=Popillia japonica TaxID=7064 RepID=A0AAW1LSN8_POPJA
MSFYLILSCLMLLHYEIKASSPTPQTTEQGNSLLWNALRMSQILLQNCLKEFPSLSSSMVRGRFDYNNVTEQMRGCLLRRSALVLDRLRAIDHLRICKGVDLVRYKDDNGTARSVSHYWGTNHTAIGNSVDWWERFVEKLDLLLETRMLKIQMKLDDLQLVEEGRRRRHHQMYPLVFFGTLAIIMITIPMGFQFLAVLGGKALLLAKLALILTSIQGLKRIATSNLNYGLYHAPSTNPWHYDRSWYYNSKDNQQGYQEGDVREPAMDFLHPLLSPRNEKIK